jgi:excisionase family DNA binding protein
MTPAVHMTTTEVADLLGISVATVNRRAAAGSLPFVFKAKGPRGPYVFDRAVVEMYARQVAS